MLSIPVKLREGKTCVYLHTQGGWHNDRVTNKKQTVADASVWTKIAEVKAPAQYEKGEGKHVSICLSQGLKGLS